MQLLNYSSVTFKTIIAVFCAILIASCSASEPTAEDKSVASFEAPAKFDKTSYHNPEEFDVKAMVESSLNADTDQRKYTTSSFSRAQLVGSLRQLQMKVKYPRQARNANAEGKVEMRVYIDEQGNFVHAETLRSPHASLTASTYRAISLSNFQPATINNKPVKSTLIIPTYFMLPN